MCRRRLTLGVALAFARLTTLSGEAQQAGKVHRIGCIPGDLLAPRMRQWDAFRQRLRELGYVEGQNIVLEFRAPEREGAPYDDLRVSAPEQVRSDIGGRKRRCSADPSSG